jgi:hypothetical protein
VRVAVDLAQPDLAEGNEPVEERRRGAALHLMVCGQSRNRIA